MANKRSAAEQAEAILLECGWSKTTRRITPGETVSSPQLYYDQWASPGASSYCYTLDSAIAECVRRG